MLQKQAGVAAWLFSAIVMILGAVNAEDPYRFFNWNVTYGNIYPLGVRQQVC
jgi:hypothetical protein